VGVRADGGEYNRVTIRSDNEGAFSAPVEDTAYDATVMAVGRVDIPDTSPVRVRPGDPPLHLIVSGSPRVAGRVIDREGEPVPYFTINDQSFASELGTFDVFVDPAQPRLIINGHGGPARLDVKLDGSGVTRVGDIVLGANDRRRELSGVVRDALGGAGIAAATIAVMAGDDCLWNGTTDRDGAFETGEIAVAPNSQLVVDRFGYQKATVALAALDHLSITLHRAIPVVIRLPGATPAEFAPQVDLESDTGETTHAVQLTNGDFEARVGPGHYVASASPETDTVGWVSKSIEVAGTPVTVQLDRLDGATQLVISSDVDHLQQVRLLLGAAVPSAFDPSAGMWATFSAGEEIRTPVAPGQYVLLVRDPDAPGFRKRPLVIDGQHEVIVHLSEATR
jgi:hypothetical protein